MNGMNSYDNLLIEIPAKKTQALRSLASISWCVDDSSAGYSRWVNGSLSLSPASRTCTHTLFRLHIDANEQPNGRTHRVRNPSLSVPPTVHLDIHTEYWFSTANQDIACHQGAGIWTYLYIYMHISRKETTP